MPCLSWNIKLERTYSNYRFTKPPFSSIFFSVNSPIISDESHAWFTCIGSVELRGTHSERKILTRLRIEPTSLLFVVLLSPDWASQELIKARDLKWPLCISSIYMEVWRVLDQVECLVVFCVLETTTELLCFFQCIYFPTCKIIQYRYMTEYPNFIWSCPALIQIYRTYIYCKIKIFVGHLISFISWVNKIHEIKYQQKYLFPIHLAGFSENPRNLMSTNLSLIWNPRNFKPTKINDSTVCIKISCKSSPSAIPD